MKTTITANDDKFLLGVSTILDRLLHGPGAKKGELHYSENVEGEYNFLRKKANEIVDEFKKSRNPTGTTRQFRGG